MSGEKKFVEIEGRVGVGMGRGRKPVNGERRPLKRVRNELLHLMLLKMCCSFCAWRESGVWIEK